MAQVMRQHINALPYVKYKNKTKHCSSGHRFRCPRASFITSKQKKDQHSFIFKYCHRPLVTEVLLTGNKWYRESQYIELTVTRVSLTFVNIKSVRLIHVQRQRMVITVHKTFQGRTLASRNRSDSGQIWPPVKYYEIFFNTHEFRCQFSPRSPRFGQHCGNFMAPKWSI